MSTVVLTDQKPLVAAGPCGCGAEKDKFKPVLGGREVCMVCGQDREVGHG